MKISHLTILLCLLSAVPAFAQQRPRFFDNFDTARGVEVQRPEFVPVGAKTPSKGKNSTTGKYRAADKPLLKPTAMVSKSGQPSRQVRMNVTEGVSDREMPNNAQYSKLLMSSAASMRGFTTGDVLIDSYIVDSSHRYSIDPLLIYSQMHQESSFKLKATSPKGASGLMQLMPATARRLGVTNIYDPKQNIDGGVKYMRMLLDMFGGDVNLALAGYNAGEGAVMKYGNQIPPYTETQEYVRRISARYSEISDPSIARNLKRVSNSKAAKLEEKVARPLSMYEPNAVAIRLADGRMRLVNQ
ncbi:MAG TPA: lytic transglycosylase domain-containing protein [Pyrinomonadaceae bacterium]|jgi:soluble lytic murein transglycosylase-like protein|nr:lytic transglycosylase domain-containing protein [Pyrinomonadaceae bacterium]